jgi:hypothetical protein
MQCIENVQKSDAPDGWTAHIIQLRLQLTEEGNTCDDLSPRGLDRSLPSLSLFFSSSGCNRTWLLLIATSFSTLGSLVMNQISNSYLVSQRSFCSRPCCSYHRAEIARPPPSAIVALTVLRLSSATSGISIHLQQNELPPTSFQLLKQDSEPQ